MPAFLRNLQFGLDAPLLNLESPHPSYWANLGDWSQTADYAQAAAALARRVGEAAGLAPGLRLFDAGFGYGEQLLLWQREFGVNSISGAELTPAHFAAARQRLPASMLLHRADALAWLRDHPHPVFDAIVSVDSAYHYRTRQRFLELAFAALAPGGKIALADLALSDSSSPTLRRTLKMIGALASIPPANLIPLHNYAAQLRDIGYTDLTIQVISAQVLPGFAAFARRHRRRYLRQYPRLGWGKLLITGWGLDLLSRVGGLEYVIVQAWKPRE